MEWLRAEREFDPDVTRETLAATFVESTKRHQDRLAARYKGGVYRRSLVDGGVLEPASEGEYAGVTYAQMRDIVRGLSLGIRELGARPGDRIGLFADTRLEWALSDFALLGAGAVVTTVFKNSSQRQVRYLLRDSDATGIIVQDAGLMQQVLAIEDELSLEFVVVMDSVKGSGVAETVGRREDIYTLTDVYNKGVETASSAGSLRADYSDEARGNQNSREEWLVDHGSDDLASLIYTSGTTGRPKGVKLSHRNFLANVEQCYRRFGPRPDKLKTGTSAIGPGTTSLSYLPLAHVLERLAGHFLMYAAGATVAYAESPDTLREDFQQIQPDVGTSVPRVYEKLYAAIRERANESAVGERLFPWAAEIARRHTRADDPGILLRAQHAIADRLVFATVREALGGNVEFLISGGGSLSKGLAELYHGMGIPVLEGYGLTETAPVVTVNPPEAPRVGTIGPPVQDVEIEIDERVGGTGAETGTVGELLVRGPNVFDGYWNRPDRTENAFTSTVPTDESETGTDEEEWFRTGDVVELRSDGYLVFRERAKQLLKLSTGKLVAPGPIEDAFAASEMIEQVLVVGDDRRFVGALIVPDFDAVRRWASERGMEVPEEPVAMCRDSRVHERIEEEVERVNNAFEEHERIKRFQLISTEFTEENGLLTPTLKKKRRDILGQFEDEVDTIYG